MFQIIRDLVKWKNTINHEVLNRARKAQRLGLEACASDLKKENRPNLGGGFNFTDGIQFN
ncbi:MAG: hypothetical protein R3E36_05710 [Nitrosomonas sp.]|nr:hypothetical protein [Nitrosomonas sp.]